MSKDLMSIMTDDFSSRSRAAIKLRLSKKVVSLISKHSGKSRTTEWVDDDILEGYSTEVLGMPVYAFDRVLNEACFLGMLDPSCDMIDLLERFSDLSASGGTAIGIVFKGTLRGYYYVLHDLPTVIDGWTAMCQTETSTLYVTPLEKFISEILRSDYGTV